MGPDLRLHAQSFFGSDVCLFVLDDRQYRSPQVCPRPGRGGGNFVDPDACPDLGDASRSLLGMEQEAWLRAGLGASRARWNIIAQQTRFAYLDPFAGPGRRAATDGWDGYPLARQRLVQDLRATKAANPIIVGGDVHAYWVSDVHSDPLDTKSPVVAADITGTSITSASGQPPENAARVVAENPHVKFADTTHHGYLRVALEATSAQVALRVTDVSAPGGKLDTLASFVVEAGKPGITKI